MTKWKPVGYKYPSGDEEWEQEFGWYKETPEYIEGNPDISIEEFKKIFKIEYLHRLLGNFIGGVFMLPMTYFWARGYFTTAMKVRMMGLLGFGGL